MQLVQYLLENILVGEFFVEQDGIVVGRQLCQVVRTEAQICIAHLRFHPANVGAERLRDERHKVLHWVSEEQNAMRGS